MAYQNEKELLQAFVDSEKLCKANIDADIRDKKQIVISAMDGADYESGALEEAQRTARNATKVLTQLLFIMVEKGLLRKKEAAEIVYNGMLL